MNNCETGVGGTKLFSAAYAAVNGFLQPGPRGDLFSAAYAAVNGLAGLDGSCRAFSAAYAAVNAYRTGRHS